MRSRDVEIRDVLTILTILSFTFIIIYALTLIPGYLRPVESDDIVGFQPGFIAVFLLSDAILIGIPA
jgi:hypothetical protein